MKDLISGILFVLIGLIFLLGSLNLEIGTSHKMGSGYFPMLISIGLMILGIFIGLKGWISYKPQ